MTDKDAFIIQLQDENRQLTDQTIAAGDVYELKVDAAWPATTLRMTLYYDDNGARIPAATRDVAITDKLQEDTSLNWRVSHKTRRF